jgi:hypothetical protein
MLPYVWDFKSLEKAEEGKYIQKMLLKTYENSNLQGGSISLYKLWLSPDPKHK